MVWLRSIVQWFDPGRRSISLALAGWIVLVVIGSGRDSNGSAWLGVPDLSGLLAVMLLLSAFVGLIFILLFRPRMGVHAAPRRRSSLRALLFIAGATVAFAMLIDDKQLVDEEAAPSIEEQLDARGAADSVNDPSADSGVDGRDMATLILLATVTAAVLVWSRSRPTTASSPEPEMHRPIDQELVSAIGDATRVLRKNGDPRAAVMASYANLETALARLGRGRDWAETPTEHMARVLPRTPTMVASAVQLARLYELARFSETVITVDDQRRAAEALDRARDELSAMAGEQP